MSTTAQKLARSPRQPTSGKWIRRERRLAIYIRDGFRCLYCGTDLSDAMPQDVSLDHLLPREHGGSNDSENLITACIRCNNGRKSEPWDDYAPHGAIPRIRAAILKPLNMVLAAALMIDNTGNPIIEARR